MLTDEQIYQNKMRYLGLLTKLGIDLTKLTDYLDSPRADFFMKPYSTYPDGAYAGALCEHNLKLYDELVSLENETGIILSGSRTQKVGYEVASALKKIKHESKMLSLEKTKNIDLFFSHFSLLNWDFQGTCFC